MGRPHAPAFVGGLVVGLVLLSLAGRATTGVDQFPGVSRFHLYLNPGTLFYPTANQVIAHARAAARADQTLVIVGGSSTMYGAGQGATELWTDVLRDALGDQFGVVNLAFPSGAPGEHGSVAAQALIREGRDVIFVTHVFPDVGDADGVSFRYVVHDALARGLLLPSVERDAALSQTSLVPSALDATREELRIRAALDSVLYATDLWESFGYHVALLAWQPHGIAGQPFWAPRSRATDLLPGTFPREMAYPRSLEEAALRVMEAETVGWCADPDGTWTRSRDLLAAQIPPGLRERTLVILLGRSPYYTARLTDAQRDCRAAFLRRLAEHLQSAGYHPLLIGEDWQDRDFVDYVHPSASGGRKTARHIAPVLKELAGR